MLAGTSARYRLYSSWGVSGTDIAKTVLFNTVTLWLGLLAAGGVVFVLHPAPFPGPAWLPIHTTLPVGIVFSAVVLAYLALTLLRKRAVNAFGWELELPGFGISVAQIVIASVDWILAGLVLFVLIPQHLIPFSSFMAAFLFAQVAGLISQIPGGLGVFETTLLLLRPEGTVKGDFLSAILIYRLVYYIVPLVIASLSFGLREALLRQEAFKRVSAAAGKLLPEFSTRFLALTTFLSGTVLLISGATPGEVTRLRWLDHFLPLPVVEGSHFLGSLTGAALLVLSRGIQRRLNSAYYLTVALLGGGVVFSLLKGGDYEEGLFLTAMLLALLPCRRYFFRRAPLVEERIPPVWFAAVLVVLAGSMWLGFFAYKHVEYSDQLWWHFSLRGDAPRFLRAAVGALAVTTTYALSVVLRPARVRHATPTPEELALAQEVAAESNNTQAYLALLGDKELMFNEANNAFLMYGIQGGSWVGMGDPVGNEKDAEELIWEFMEACDEAGGRAAFYEVGHRWLYLYLNAGFTLLKIGEEARVLLPEFSLEGKGRKALRYTFNKLQKEGAQFEVIARERVPELLPEFRRISDQWLKDKNTREKGFSMGFFDERYLRNFPAVVVRINGEIAAFANLWLGKNKEDASVDLMRHRPGSPPLVMEYLFLATMLWAKEAGYQWFSLGMAPLSGLGTIPSMSLWNRLGHFLFRYGEYFYNFKGLRDYKEKFDPAWEARYLAYPGGLSLPTVLTDTAALVARGFKGVVAK